MNPLFRLLLLLALLGGLPALGQTTYPVQVNAHLLPPYSLYLSDYYSGTSEKLTLTLLNRDLMQPTLNVRLRMSINAPGGLRIQTRPEAYLPAILLESGQPLRLSLEELAPYFQLQNFFEQGSLRDGKLPEGMVEFCFQAFEAYTNQPLSAPGCTRAFITSQKPPLLSLPQNNESIAFREPLNLLFQWTPRHQGMTYVEYEFILKELTDNGMAVQAAFPYSPEIFRQTVRSTSLLYGPMQAPLLPGKRYAWCVRAQARAGVEEVNLFQNNGYSEVRTFTLQDNCTPPALVTATAERRRINLSWQPLPQSVGYTVSYRLKDQAEWKELATLESQATLAGLQKGGTYEYRVGSACMAGQPVYGSILTLTLPQSDSARLAQCGILPAINLNNQQPIPALKTGEVVMANDFPVTLTQVSGSNGTFSGAGWTVIPWLNDAKIAVTFTGITVNTDRQMISGYIDAQYDAKEGQIANLDDVFEGGFDVGTVKTGITQVDYTFDFSIPGVEAFRLNEAGELVITDSNGEPHRVGAGEKEGQGNEGNKVVVFPLTVQDKDGRIYQVEKVPDPANPGKEVAKATYVGKAGAALAADSFDASQLDGNKAIVSFEKGAGRYGFDTWQPYYEKVALIKNKYQRIYADSNGEYYAPWKLLPVGKSEPVIARIRIKDPTIDPTQVIFKTPKGTEFKAEYDPTTKTYQLSVVAGPAGDAQEVYALYPRGQGKYYNLGKLSVASYAPQSHKVVLVPVEGAPIEEQAIRQALEQVYGPAGITWQVEKAPSFSYAGNPYLMQQSTGLATYNADMRTLNNQYRQALGAQFDPKANYLFFLKATGATTINNRDATGFMPRGAQFGYLFTSEIEKDKQAMTVAHELGHGRWKLYHTFDPHYGGFGREQTPNVMDYANGAHLAKWQWDLIHDPAMLVSIFEGDEKSKMLTANDLPKDFLNGTTYNFITPTGKKITLPENCVVTFHFGILNSAQIRYPIGYLHRFEIKNDKKELVEYTARISNGIFKGYYDAKNQPYANTLTSQDKNDNVVLLVPEKEGIRYTKYQASLADFAPDETVLDYATFPIQSYLQPTILKKSDLRRYESILGVIQHQNEDWTLHKDFFGKALHTHDGKAEHSLIVKIVELRVAYRALFEQFTDPQCYESWNSDVTVYSLPLKSEKPIYTPCRGKWEETLRKEPALINQWKNNPPAYYTRFLRDFIQFIADNKLNKEAFLASLSLQTSQGEATDFLMLCSNQEITNIPWQKRKILFQVLMKGDKLTEQVKQALIRLIAYTPVAQRESLLTFLADEIKFKNIFNRFNTFLGADNFCRVVTLLSSFIEAPQPYLPAYQQALAPNPSYVNIDLDILLNKHTSGYKFDDANNTIHFYNEVSGSLSRSAYHESVTPTIPRNQVFLTVPYDQTIPVQFWNRFDLVNGKVYEEKEVVSLPALYVALLLEKGNKELFSKKAWLLADGVTLLMGAGEVKIALSGASWLRRAMAASSIIGSASGIVVESLPSSVISDSFRNKLRMLNLVLSIPEAALGLRELGKGIVKELRAAKQNTTLVAEQKQIEDLALALEKSLGGVGETIQSTQDLTAFTANAVRLNTGAIAQLSALKLKAGDGVIDLIIHGEASRYFAQIETASGSFQQMELSVSKLADLIGQANLDPGSAIRLLSCSSLESAQELSKALGNRSLMATDGLVRIHEDGGITTVVRDAAKRDVSWYEFKNGTRTGLAKTPDPPSAHLKNQVGRYVQMGEDLKKSSLDGVAAWKEFLVRLDKPELSTLKAKLSSLDEAIQLKFVDDFANAADDVLKQIGANDGALVDSWKVLMESGETGLSSRIKDIELVDDYLKKNPGKAATKVTEEMKSKGWQKWGPNLLRNFFAQLDRMGLTALKGKIAALDEATQLKFVDDFANAADDVLKQIGANDGTLVDSWKVVMESGETGLSSRIKDVELVNDYLKKNPGKTADKVTEEIKSKGWQKWGPNLLKNFLARLDQLKFTALKAKLASLDEAIQLKFVDDFESAADDVLKALGDEELVLVWEKSTANLNRTNITWLRWVKNGRKTVPELIPESSTHINKGEIKITFQDGSADFVSTPDKIWTEMGIKFMTDDLFAKAILKTNNIKGQSFVGMHNIDEIEKFAQQTIPLGLTQKR